MAEIGSAFLSILPSAKGFGSKLESEVGGETRGTGKKMGAGFGTAFKVGAAAAIGGGLLAANFLKGAIADAREAQKVAAATTSIIKATGGAAKISAGQVADLAGEIARKTGIDDGQIQAGENLLLTFKNVKREGEGLEDIFGRATLAGADLAAAGFGSISGNAIQLGKALNDPLKGIAALAKSGVTFTEVQKEQIKGFVEQNDLLSAQKIILGEVEAQVGGTAEATATAGEKFSYAFGEFKESVGTALLPVLDNLFNKVLTPGINAVTDAFDKGGLAGVGTLLRDKIVAALPIIKSTLKQWGTAFVEWVKDVAPPMLRALGTVLAALGGWIIGTGLPFLWAKVKEWGKAFIDWILPLIPPAIEKLGQFAGAAFGWIIDTGLPLLISKLGEWGGALIEWIGPKIPPLLLELGKLVAALGVWILTVGLPKWYGFLLGLGKALIEWVAPQIPGLLTELGNLIGRASIWLVTTGLPLLQDAIKKYGSALIAWVAPRIPGAVAELSKFTARIAQWIVTQGLPTFVAATTRLGVALIRWIAPQAAIATVELTKFVGRLTGWLITQGLPALAEACFKMGTQGFQGLVRAAAKVTVELTNFTASIPGRVVSALGDLGSVLFGAGQRLVEGLIQGIKSKIGELAGQMASLAGMVTGHLPGSPVKTGPLKSWNDGKGGVSAAGARLMDGLAKGIGEGGPKVADKMREAMEKVVAALESKRDRIRGVLDGFKSDFASLSSSITGAFTGNLFDASAVAQSVTDNAITAARSASQVFINGLTDKSAELSGLLAAFKTLRGFGISPAFLSQLFASGNGALILDLAAGSKSQATQAETLFGQVGLLGQQLGNTVAQADIGPKIDRQTALQAAANKELREMKNELRKLAKDIGKELNAAVTHGQRSAA